MRMGKYFTGFAVVALFSLVGCAMDAEEPGEPWDGLEDGASAPALAPDDDSNDVSGPERDTQPSFEPLEDDDDEDDDTDDVDDTEPVDDLECDTESLVANTATDCTEAQVFAGGCCWDDLQTACSALACDTDCLGITTVPLTAACVPG